MRDLTAALNIIKPCEGCVLHAYRDPVGVWTIGYGHTAGVYEGQIISQDEANFLLLHDLSTFSLEVENCLKKPANENQFSAFVSFSFNVGIGAFKGSTMLRDFNEGLSPNVVAQQFMLWVHAGAQVLPGLVKRRRLEMELFLKAS